MLLTCLTILSKFIIAQTYKGSIGSSGDERGQGLVQDAAGNVYITGSFMLTADFDIKSGVTNLTANGVGKDIFVAKYSPSGELLWAKAIGDANDDGGYGIAVDAAGNVYVTGTFAGTVDFDPGAGMYNLTSVGLADVFICKLDGSGNFLWAKSFGGTSFDNAGGIALDGFGAIYTTGAFSGTVDFDPGPGVSTLASTSGAYNLFVSKLDAAGNFLWAKAMGGSGGGGIMAFGIAVDGSSNVITTGYYTGLTDFDPGPGVAALNTQDGGQGCYVSKLDGSGNYVWARSFDSPGGEAGQAIALDGSGNAYITGSYQMTVDFDPGAGVVNLTSVGGTQDIFIVKLDGAGSLVWAKSFGGNSADVGFGITLDKTGNIYATGEFGATADFDPGTGVFNLTANGNFVDVFVLKLDAAGNFSSAQGLGGPQNDWGIGIAADDAGNVITTGVFAGTADFDPGPGVANLISEGGLDIFLSKLNTVTVLPVRLLDFSVFAGPSGNVVRWQTASAVNVKEFVIERSNGSQDFIPVGTVAAAKQDLSAYQYLDKFSSPDATFYRLKTVDADGSYAYTRVLKVEGQKNEVIKITPHPVTNAFSMHFSAYGLIQTRARLVDVFGRTVKEFTVRENGQLEDMSQYPSGTYFLRLADGDVIKIVKQ